MGRNKSPLQSVLHPTAEASLMKKPHRVSKPGPGPPTLGRGDPVTYLGNAASMNSDCLEQSFDSFFGLQASCGL